MKRVYYSWLILIMSIVLVTACGKNQITGKWKTSGNNDNFFYTFNDDKTCIYESTSIKMECTYEIEDNKITITYKGSSTPNLYSYKLDGDTLILKDKEGNEEVYKK